jgi:tetratricopeptide (TPR) repeat protein
MKIRACLFFYVAASIARAQTCAPARSAAKALDEGNAAQAERILAPYETSALPCNEILLSLARLRTAQKQFRAAETLFARYIVMAPMDANGPLQFARFLFSMGEYPRADEMSAKAVSLDGTNAEALALQGQLLVMKGEAVKGQLMLEQACKVDPANAEAHFQLGSLMDRQKQNAKAIEHFQKVIALEPKNPRAYDYLALNLEPLGEIEKAGLAYEKALQVNVGPQFDSFLDYNYGRFLLKCNRLAESKKHLDRAVELTPRVRAVRYERGKLNLRLGNFSDARIDAEKALSLPDPGKVIIDLQLYNLLQSIYTRLGEEELSRKYAELSRNTPVPLRSESPR